MVSRVNGAESEATGVAGGVESRESLLSFCSRLFSLFTRALYSRPHMHPHTHDTIYAEQQPHAQRDLFDCELLCV